MESEEQMVQVRWEGNNSHKCDGRVQDIAVKFVKQEDMDGRVVGAVVRVCSGQQMQMSRAVVVR